MTDKTPAWKDRLNAADGKLTASVGLRMTERMYATLERLADHHGMSKAMMVRTMVLVMLDQVGKPGNWQDDNTRRTQKKFLEVKFSPGTIRKLEERAEFMSLTRAAVVRLAIHNYLGAMQDARKQAVERQTGGKWGVIPVEVPDAS